MAATIEVPVSRPPRPQHHRRFAAPVTIGVALMVTVVIAALMFIAVSCGVAPASTGHRTGTPVIVPHPTPGPSGS